MNRVEEEKSLENGIDEQVYESCRKEINRF